MKEFWQKVEDCLTHIPKVILWIMIAISVLTPIGWLGFLLLIITIILFHYHKD